MNGSLYLDLMWTTIFSSLIHYGIPRLDEQMYPWVDIHLKHGRVALVAYDELP